MIVPERNRRAVAAARKAAGSQYRLAKGLDINPQAIQQWEQIPAERVIEVERLTLLPREQLRPDLYLTARPKGMPAPTFHIPAVLHKRIEAVLHDSEDVTHFIRAAINRELEQRGAPEDNGDTDIAA